MSEPKHPTISEEPTDTAAVPEPAAALTDDELDSVSGGLLPAVQTQLNLTQALQGDQRSVVSSVGGIGVSNLKTPKI
jgi:hypothetical protein